LALTLVVAALLRSVVYVELADGPWPHLQAWTQSDMHFFDHWARTIAAGDLLTREDMRPYHGRHRDMACAAVRSGSPDSTACSDEQVRATWDTWVGAHTFWQDPLYPYLMAVPYALFGPAGGSRAVQVAQTLLGLASVVLVHLLALRSFGATAAVAAGLMAALYGPLLMYETVLLRAAVIGFCALAACWLLVAAQAGSGSRFRAAAAGLASGVLCLLKMSALLSVGAWAAVLALGSRGRRWLPIVYLAAVALVFVPLVARNAAVGAALLQGASTGPLNFVNGNAADRAAGTGSAVSDLAVPIMSSASGRGSAAIAAAVRSHGSVASWLRLLGAKLLAFFEARELPNNVNYRYFRLQAPAVARLAIGFPVVLGFAIVGLVGLVSLAGSARSRTIAACFPLAYVATGIVTCVLFFNLSRFRLPIALMMMPIAGGGYAFIVEQLRARKRLGALLACALAAAVALGSVMLGPDREALRIADYGVANQITEQLARRSLAAGAANAPGSHQSLAAATALVERQLRTEPSELQRIEPGAAPTRVSVELSGIAGTFVGLHQLRAELAALSGDERLAAQQRRRAAVLRALNRPYEAAGSG
jgi:4-amino-4-deoxy-L-arabinose transferase-like glycosyltransferase